MGVKHEETLANLEAMKVECIDALDCKHNVASDDMASIKVAMSGWRKDLDLNGIKISETAWENIRVDSTNFIQFIEDKLKKVKSDFILNREIKFEADVTKMELLNYGKLTVRDPNLNSVILVGLKIR